MVIWSKSLKVILGIFTYNRNKRRYDYAVKNLVRYEIWRLGGHRKRL